MFRWYGLPVKMRKKSGFSIVEILVALVIFSLVILGLVSVFIAAGKHITHARERMTSAQLGKFFLDPLQTYVSQETWDKTGNKLALGSWPGTTQSINNRNFSEVHEVSVISDTDLRRVISKITWTEPTS